MALRLLSHAAITSSWRFRMSLAKSPRSIPVALECYLAQSATACRKPLEPAVASSHPQVVTDRWIKAQSLNTNYTHPLSILAQMV
ncbi:hypothetical protein SPURM210S_02574 [Streptomyces purpurascens]